MPAGGAGGDERVEPIAGVPGGGASIPDSGPPAGASLPADDSGSLGWAPGGASGVGGAGGIGGQADPSGYNFSSTDFWPQSSTAFPGTGAPPVEGEQAPGMLGGGAGGGIGAGPPDMGGGPVPPSRSRMRAKARGNRRRRLIIEWGIVLAIAALIAILLRAFVVQAFFVPSPSMEPTLQVGDRILVVKSSLLVGSIGRGDIVVFHHPHYFPCSGGSDDIEDLVKRVIGLPGETIVSRGNTIYIDGKPLSEPGWYRPGEPQVGAMPITQTKIPAGDYFVMGDNRTDSCDSRSFGVITGSSVVGKVVAIVWRNGHPYIHFF